MPFALDPALHWVFRLALALLFLAAASHKLAGFAAFILTLERYAILPARFVRAGAVCLTALEVGAAGALILFASGGGAVLAAGLLALYSAAIAVNLVRGRSDLECGCSLAGGGQKLGAWLLARNGALFVAALLIALPPSSRSLTWLDGFTVAACTLSLALVYHGMETVAAHRSVLSASRSRWALVAEKRSTLGGRR